MIWRNANGRISLEAYVMIGFACLAGNILGAFMLSVIQDRQDPEPYVYIVEEDGIVQVRTR